LHRHILALSVYAIYIYVYYIHIDVCSAIFFKFQTSKLIFFGSSGSTARGSGAARPTFPGGQAAPGFQSAAQKPKTTPLSLDHPFWSSELIFISERLLCEELLRHSSTLLQHDPHNTDAMLQQYAALPGSLTNLTSLEPVLPPFLR